ncbi:MAG: LamG domain-containing protein, partial [Candidatus Poribacteria bacterium]
MKKTIIILLTLITALITPPAFAVNQVLSLDGDGDYVEIKDSESLNPINSQVTMEAWIKATKFANDWMPIIYKGDERTPNFSNRSYTLWLGNLGQLHLASATSGKGRMYLNSPNGSIKFNIWYHVAGVIDVKNSVMSIFINGTEVARQPFGEDIHISKLPLRIGWTHEEDSTYSPFAGQIDEVRIWNVARTAEQIRETMFKKLTGGEGGLAGLWDFDSGDARDSTANGYDGELFGD